MSLSVKSIYIRLLVCRGNIPDIYYYSHIFPDSRAQHCNYATLLVRPFQECRKCSGQHFGDGDAIV